MDEEGIAGTLCVRPQEALTLRLNDRVGSPHEPEDNCPWA